jgi:chorismate mutase
MTERPIPEINGAALDALRRELDALDDSMIELLARRFAVTSQVKSFKQVTAKTAMSPLRPAREAQIHRRLLAKSRLVGLDPQMVFKLWRGILTQSSLSQAAMTVHLSRRLTQTIGHRLRIRDHFPGMAVEEWRDEAQVLTQVGVSAGDICVVETDSPWVEGFVAGLAGTAQVIASLPAISDMPVPQLLIIGNAPAESTGNDETLLISHGNLPRDFALQPLWQFKSGAYKLSALAGFHSEQEAPLVGVARSNAALGLKVAGRYPSTLEI